VKRKRKVSGGVVARADVAWRLTKRKMSAWRWMMRKACE